MTYADFFAEIKGRFMAADVSDIHEHLAYQFNITGEAEGIFYVEVKDGKVADAAAYSDALKPDIILELPDCLRQARCSKKELCTKLETLHPDTTDEQEMLQEIREWLWSVEL